MSFHREEFQSGNYHTCATIHKHSGFAHSWLLFVNRFYRMGKTSTFLSGTFSVLFFTPIHAKISSPGVTLTELLEREKISPTIFGFLLFNLGISTQSVANYQHHLDDAVCGNPLAGGQKMGSRRTMARCNAHQGQDRLSFITGHCDGLVPEFSIVHFPS